MEMKKVIFIVNILIVLLASTVIAGARSETIEGYVPYINGQYLFIGDKEYPIAKDVKVFAESDNKREISLKESGILGVGKIDKAIVTIDKGIVVQIVILEVLQ